MGRLIAVIASVLLSLAAYQADAKGGGKQSATGNAVSASFQNISASDHQAPKRAQSTKEQNDKCGPEQYGSNADLCAQWKAADAASDSAWWAWVSGLVGFGSLVGVLAALGIALHSNRIARDTAKRQLRAYLSVEPGGICEAADGVHQVPLDLINNGQTPAYDLHHGGDFLIITGDPRQFDPAVDGRLKELDPEECVAVTDGHLGPNTNRSTYAYLDEALTKPFRDQIFKKEAAIVHYGFFRYKDAFGEQRQTNFAFYHWGDDLSDVYSKRCRFGNDAD